MSREIYLLWPSMHLGGKPVTIDNPCKQNRQRINGRPQGVYFPICTLKPKIHII